MVPDHELCYLTTVGRQTRKAHEVEIWYSVSGDRIYLLSGGRDRSDWVRNLVASPSARVRFADGRVFSGRGRIVSDDTEDALARRLLASKYEAWREGRPLSAWARTALPVAIDLEAPEV